MTLTSILTILAILFGPLLAVQMTRYLDDRKAKRDRKIYIYRTLMATRAANLSAAHVEALNHIDIEFNGNSQNLKSIRDAWKIYLDHLSTDFQNFEAWNNKRIDLLVDMLFEMGKHLRYHFDKVHLKKSIYSPKAHGDIENDQEAIRRGLRELLEGSRPIPINIVGSDTDDAP